MALLLGSNDKHPRAPVAAAATGDDGILPPDLVHEVLLRLPAKVLCRLRLVCRSWRSLTSDPIFAKAHSFRHHPLVVGLRSVAGLCSSPSREVQFLDPITGNIVKKIHTGHDWDGHELTTDLGLLCVSERYEPGKTCLLNPSTGAIAMMLTAGCRATELKNKSILLVLSMSVLGRVPSTDEYKVLRISWDINDTNNDEAEQNCDVISVGGGGDDIEAEWRVRPHPPVPVNTTSMYRAVVKGVVYFMCLTNVESDAIASFDLATEEWRQAMLRGPLSSNLICAKEGDRIVFHLANLNGSLVTICRYGRGYLCDDCSMDLWFLEDVEKGLWTKLYSVQCAPLFHKDGLFTPLGILDGERILIWVEGARELRAYDPRTSTWINLSSVESIFDVAVYQGSLLCSDIMD